MIDIRTETAAARQPVEISPPGRHQSAAMIWLAVFSTLTTLNLAFGDLLRPMSPVLRTFVLATTAVPIIVYGVMPQLHRLRHAILTRAAR